MSQQLPLAVSLRDDSTFDNYWVSSANEAAAFGVQHFLLAEETSFYLWGAPGAGVTHLLQALQHSMPDAALLYLPLDELRTADPHAMLENLEQLDLVCLDRIDAVVGLADWEEALFHLFNRIKDHGSRLALGANAPPRELGVSLADLQSRLSWGAVYHVHELSDADKCAALQMRARRLGLELHEEVAKYLLHHTSRDTHQLFSRLTTLDHHSLAEQRKLTIPFVKQILEL